MSLLAGYCTITKLLPEIALALLIFSSNFFIFIHPEWLTMKRYILFWFVLLVLAFANGALREIVYRDVVGEPWAHHLSVVTGILFVGIAIWYAVTRWNFTSARQAISIGAIWIVLTEIFEFFLILSNPDNTFDDFLHAHNMTAGEMWPVFVLWIGIAPVLFYKLQNTK